MIPEISDEKKYIAGKPSHVAQTSLYPPGIDRYTKILLLGNRWATQIQVVGPGGPSEP